MRELGLLLSNYILFTILAALLAALQASFWFHIFGSAPSPYLWLLIVCYWTLYRHPIEAVIMTYIVSFILVSMSGIPLSMSFALNLSLVGLLYLLRDRVLWGGVNSFTLAAGIAGLSLPILTFVWSLILEPRSTSDFYFFEWALRAPLTSLFALPFYFLFVLIDKITQKEAPRDSESEFI